MHVIQHGHLVTLPDDAPVPEGSVEIKPPEAYLDHPELYAVTGDRLVRRTKKEAHAMGAGVEQSALKLTQDEIRVLKEAIAKGRLGGTKKESS